MDTNLNSSLKNNAAPAFKIEEGFAVHDSHDNAVGTVLTFRFSDDNPRTAVTEAATPTAPDTGQRNSLIENAIEAFAGDGDSDMPQELRESLLQQGFIRIRQGLLMPDLFATMKQVSSVSGDVVHLNVPKDQLVAR